ncbi:ATP-binding protein [Pseudobacteriovorax antillogorgiicola]|uniref:histidine kinase n=1 Tax=Pseudobacteriovorax antillogorgiicola TaxID=1513793 RepID=A0A1Y6BF37_9BACT|nr:ATP-binding protein [Pseudobacteriovorax antillogorgiicola]TCS56338.1 signal transduction histidine kinase [Pseudobacteriovorax antillogorgiicola]SMF06879.1 Signal transduction histidine kinase [Pseudobacteriovorax antillogorgiicola]
MESEYNFRRKVLIGLSISIGLAELVAVIFREIVRPYQDMGFYVGLFVGISLFLNGMIARKFQSTTFSAHTFLALCVGFLTYSVGNDLGIQAPGVVFLSLVPVLAFFLLGFSNGVAYTVYCLLFLLALAWGDISGSWPSRAITAESRAQLAGVIGAIAVVMGGSLGAVFEWNRSRTLKRLDELNKRLREEKAIAEQASKHKSQFLANMSHEIRTPMNGILGMNALLKEEVSDPYLEEKIAIIESSSNHLLRVIDDILDFSKLENKMLALEEITFNLDSLFNETVLILEEEAKKSKVAIQYNLASGVPHWISGDPTRIRQVMINLLSNGIKFSDGNDVVIEVAREADNLLKVNVIDKGIGIPEDKLEHIFSSFTQSDISTTRKFGGTGLGLSISRTLARLMGGDLTVESRLGEGATFTFRFSYKKASAPAEGQSSDPTLMTDYSSLRVLVVEDNEVNQQVIDLHLKKLKIQADLVSNGQEAVDQCQTKVYDLILMDCHMPVLDGFEATQKILESNNGNEFIVALTAGVLPEEQARCREVGMVDVLLKPLNRALLMSVLERAKRKEAA